MADVVNATHKSALSQRNSEPSHLSGGGHEALGGPPLFGGGPDSYKIDAARGVGTDSSIPKSVAAEPSHLKSEEAGDDDMEVSFGDDDTDSDDLDDAIDTFESVEPVEVDVDMKEEDEKDEDEMVKEEDDKDEKDNPFVKEEDDKDDKDNPFVKEEDDKDDDNPFVKEEDEKDEKDNPFVKEEDDKDDDNPFVKEEDDKDEDEPIAESVKLRISLPKTTLFESVNLSKRDQKKVGVVFESVIKATTKQISEQLHQHYKKLHEQKLARRDAAMTKQVDAYLNYVVETWVKENRPAIRTSLRSQLAENFLNGLQKLFTEHYVDVPESKINVVNKLNEELKATKQALNEQTSKTLKLKRLAESANKARIVADFARKNNLSEAQSNKLAQLAESVAYTKAPEFREKLAMLKESYFNGTGSKKTLPTLTEETIHEPATQKKGAVGGDADVAAIADMIARSARQQGY